MLKKIFIIMVVVSALCAASGRVYAVDTGDLIRGEQRTYLGPHSSDVFDIRFRAAPIRDVLHFLAWLSGINIVMPEDLAGVVSVDFKQIEVGDAINSVIKASDLDYAAEGGVIRVASKADFKDTGENLRTATFRLRFATARTLTDSVKKLLSTTGSVIADERTNSLIVRELSANIDNVRRFVDDIDIKDAQVLIESKILQATRRFGRSLGIQWGINKDSGTVRVQGVEDVGTSQNGNNLNVNLGADTPTSGLGMLIGSIAGLNIDAAITAAEERGDLYIISDPSIVTSNGQPARIRSGETLYIQTLGDSVNIGTGTTGTVGGSNTGLQEIETGIELKVTPQISIGEYVKLEIEATTSQPDFSRKVQGLPVIIDNVAKTTVLVRDGETTVIGGLSRDSDSLNKKDVPFLSKIPLFGNLFKNKTRQRENSELMVFITPKIVKDEGTLPAQVRVREIEERAQSMQIEPILKTDAQIALEQEKNAARMRITKEQNKGNKYVR